jgi:exopolyphosphatase / guanosine-5'-triphosphate,3'-diphosphate pyrophosphatase
MRIAALDVGSNSFHLIVAQVHSGGRIEILDRAKDMVRLGESTLRTGIIPPDSFARGIEALKSLRRLADRYQPDALVAVATSAVREAQNGGEFARAARDEAGIEIRVVRGKEEARLIYLGARSALDLSGRRVAIFDVGGGSVEIILADSRECYYTESLKLGVLRIWDEWAAGDPPSSRDMAALSDRLRRALDPAVSRLRVMGFDFAALTSGTAFALGALLGQAATQNAQMRGVPYKPLVALERKLASMTSAERAKLPGLDRRRANTILMGAVLVRTILELAGVDRAVLCEAALREGIVAEYVAKNRPGIQLVEEFPDQRRRTVMELARRCHYMEAHSQHVAKLALSIFHQTRDLHGLSNADAILLEYIAILHDIGFYVSAARHHRHSHYLIESDGMKGFSREEVQTMALVARYHRKATPKKSHPEFAQASKQTRNKVLRLAAILRLADGLDRNHKGVVRSVRCTITNRAVELRLEADDDPELELWAARRKGDLFEDLFERKLRFAVERTKESAR